MYDWLLTPDKFSKLYSGYKNPETIDTLVLQRELVHYFKKRVYDDTNIEGEQNITVEYIYRLV